MLQATQYQKIFKTPNYQLQIQKNQTQSIRLQIRTKKSISQTQIYQSRIDNLDQYEKLKQFTDTLASLKQYIKNPQNVNINMRQNVLEILQVSAINRSKRVVLAAIKLVYKQSIKKEPIQGIIQRCNMRDQLQMDQFKQFFQILAFYVQESYANSNAKNKKKGQMSMRQIGSQQQQQQLQEQEQFINKKQLRNFKKQLTQQITKITETHLTHSKKLIQQAIQFSKNIDRELSKKIDKVQDYLVQFKQKYNKNTNGFDTTDVQVQISNMLKDIAKRVEQIQCKMRINTNAVYSYIGANIRSMDNVDNKTQQNNIEKSKIPSKTTTSPSQNNKFNKFINTKTINSLQWVDNTCYHFNRLNLTHSSITVYRQDAHVFGRMKVHNYIENMQKNGQIISLVHVFTVRIKKMVKIIGIGLIDSSYRQKSSMGAPPNALVYYKDGYYNGTQRKNNPPQVINWKQGDVVSLWVDEVQGRAEWKVQNRDIKLELISQNIKDKGIEWVPYLYLTQSDCLQLCQQ